ncbi:hypothetical protein L2E75_23395 [Planktothrix agardhii 1807]|nr:hypothetical protein [Planktothrix agardhii]MCF3569055.1 hypothetical protein [Planktothrix agardhii 1807]
MKADLQELMITEGEIKKIVGKFSNLEDCLHCTALVSLGLIFLLVKNIINFVAVNLTIIIICILITILIIYFIIKLDGKKNQRVRLLLSEVRKHNQIITNLYTLDQLEAVGNPVKINDRVKVIEALRITREGLVRALKTEKILRENPNFKPEYFNIDLTSLQAEKTMVKAIEYAQLLDDAVQIGVSVQTEMRKLQNNR